MFVYIINNINMYNYLFLRRLRLKELEAMGPKHKTI